MRYAFYFFPLSPVISLIVVECHTLWNANVMGCNLIETFNFEKIRTVSPLSLRASRGSTWSESFSSPTPPALAQSSSSTWGRSARGCGCRPENTSLSPPPSSRTKRPTLSSGFSRRSPQTLSEWQQNRVWGIREEVEETFWALCVVWGRKWLKWINSCLQLFFLKYLFYKQLSNLKSFFRPCQGAWWRRYSGTSKRGERTKHANLPTTADHSWNQMCTESVTVCVSDWAKWEPDRRRLQEPLQTAGRAGEHAWQEVEQLLGETAQSYFSYLTVSVCAYRTWRSVSLSCKPYWTGSSANVSNSCNHCTAVDVQACS